MRGKPQRLEEDSEGSIEVKSMDYNVKKGRAPFAGALEEGEVVGMGWCGGESVHQALMARFARLGGSGRKSHARIIPASSSQGNGSETAGSFFQGGLRW